jgi:adenine-specific DNA-methyltransferase
MSAGRDKLGLNMAARFEIQNRRYIGSKQKLLDWMFSNIAELCPGGSFLDVFAGTGVVGARALEHYSHVIFNDFLYSNKVIYKAFFDSNSIDQSKMESLALIMSESAMRNRKSNYFDLNFGNKFFSIDDARSIGNMRLWLKSALRDSQINESEFHFLLASLIYSADKVSNTVGHYDAFIQKGNLQNKFILSLIQNIDTSDHMIDIFQEDANILAGETKADVVFMDPPYNSRQYSRFYHVLENLAEWKEPPLFGTALKPEPQNMSDYSKVKAPDTFAELVRKVDCKFIVTTYNNTFRPQSSSSKNKITYEEILSSLGERGTTQVFESQHKFFNAGKTTFNDHKELLFITEVQS